MDKYEREQMSQRYKREFEVALVKICLAVAGISFIAGNITCFILLIAGK